MPRTPVPPDNAELRVEYVDIDVLSRWPGNAKQHDLGAIASSVLRFGMRDPIGVNRRTHEIEEGHGRLDTLAALRRQGRSAPAFVRVDNGRWLVPVLFFDDDDLTAHAYSLAHNRTQDLGGGYDDALLLAALREQADAGSMEGIGFDPDDIASLRARLETVDRGAAHAPAVVRYQIVIECADEQEQIELLERLQDEGLNAKAVNA